MSDAKPILSLQGIVKRFGKFTALDGVNFDIGQGEFFSLLGASGCGKTTLLRILAGIEQPSEGQLLIDGQPARGIPANKRPTNMVFQSYAIFPHLNVEENVGYGLRNLKISKDEAKARMEEALALVKLDGYATRNAHQLSGGQRQRVALARALVMKPKVLLLDEPLSALDKKLREEMQLELRALQRSVGITFVFVTHDQEEALTLSDRIAIMHGGKVLQIDTPQGLYERPNSRRVAEFIGTMNLIEGKVEAVTDTSITLDTGPFGRVVGSGGGLSAGDQAWLAVRPEKLSIGQKGTNSISGKVLEATYLGDRIHYRVDVPGADQPLTVFVNNAEGQEVFAPNSSVTFGFNEVSARILPA
jgi:spermidine/putrescine ABC transporter ATP-binding subunit